MQTTQLSVPTDIVDLGIGQPGHALLPTELLAQASSHCLGKGDPAVLQYGAQRGSGPFRDALAQMLCRHYQTAVSADDLFVSTGASQGLDLICARLTQPNDTILVEDPTYFLALYVLRDHGLNIVGVPVDEHGMVVDALDEAIERHQPTLIYTIPAFHNPCAVTMPHARRQRLVEITAKRRVTVVADEVYQLLHFGKPPPLPLTCYPDADHVLSLGSFSKILAPGLRLGWVHGPKSRLKMLARTGYLVSGGGLNPFTSAVVHSAIELGLQEHHLERVRGIYATRSEALCEALRSRLGDAVSFTEPQGGYFVWLRFAEGVDATEVLAAARAHKVGFRAGVDCSCSQQMKRCARLSFAYYDVEALEAGVERLAAALASLS